MSYQLVTKQVEDYVSSSFIQHLYLKLFYHNLNHTREVVNRSTEIALFYKLDEEKMFIVTTAAWFHDIGYLFVGSHGHEDKSVDIMKDFLSSLQIPVPVTDAIGKCIMATKRSVSPASLLEEIICDADTYHFGTSNFKITNLKVRREIEAGSGIKLKNWKKSSLILLTNHQFYTSYCREKLTGGKKRNIDWLSPWYMRIKNFFSSR